MSDGKKTIVVSAVSLRKGGTLTILRDCLCYLSTLAVDGHYRIIALVHKGNWQTIRVSGTLKCRILSKAGVGDCGVSM